jgi:hypothetical protein
MWAFSIGKWVSPHSCPTIVASEMVSPVLINRIKPTKAHAGGVTSLPLPINLTVGHHNDVRQDNNLMEADDSK